MRLINSDALLNIIIPLLLDIFNYKNNLKLAFHKSCYGKTLLVFKD